jgi:vancomycin resistance protein YoaR
MGPRQARCEPEVAALVLPALLALLPAAATLASPQGSGESRKPSQGTPALAHAPVHRIALTDGVRTVRRTPKELGLAPSPDAAELRRALKRLAPKFHQDAINAKPFVYRGQVQIDPGSYSRALDIEATAHRLAGAYRSKPALSTFPVSLDKKPPVLTAERLKGINGVLGTMTTQAWVNEKRNKNIRLAIGRIDGTLLSPGEQFSLNQAVGERTQLSGFRTAPIFVNAEVTPGIGGGVSQVTGTLFNAAARSGFRIDEAYLHSRPVKYLPIGYDATVVWGEHDLRFTNDSGAPAYIAMSFARQQMTASIFGARRPERTVRLKADVRHVGPGKIDSQLYRTIREGGKVTDKRVIATNKYRWDPTKKE